MGDVINSYSHLQQAPDPLQCARLKAAMTIIRRAVLMPHKLDLELPDLRILTELADVPRDCMPPPDWAPSPEMKFAMQSIAADATSRLGPQASAQPSTVSGPPLPPTAGSRSTSAASQPPTAATQPQSSDPAADAQSESSSRKAPQDADGELAEKLREAQRQLEKKFGSNSKPMRGRYDRALLEREIQDERNRAAWAKAGKDPPAPKDANLQAESREYPPQNVPKKQAPITQKDVAKRPLSTYASSQETPAVPAADNRVSSTSSRAVPKPAATPAKSSGAPRASTAEMPSRRSSEPAASTASENSLMDQPASDASEPALANGPSTMHGRDEEADPGHTAAFPPPDDAEPLPSPARTRDIMAKVLTNLGGAKAESTVSTMRRHFLAATNEAPESDQDASDQEDGGEDGDGNEGSDEEYEDEGPETHDAAAASEEELEATHKTGQMLERYKKDGTLPASKELKKSLLRQHHLMQRRLLRKEAEALNNATKLLL